MFRTLRDELPYKQTRGRLNSSATLIALTTIDENPCKGGNQTNILVLHIDFFSVFIASILGFYDCKNPNSSHILHTER